VNKQLEGNFAWKGLLNCEKWRYERFMHKMGSKGLSRSVLFD
jgi:hypothetical protein